MSENNSSDTRVSPTASYLAVDADFNTLMDELTLEAEGQVELAATAREQALMDHQHKFYGSEAKAQPRQMIRETGRGVMESSETIARFHDNEPSLSHGGSFLPMSRCEQQPRRDEIFREEPRYAIPQSPPPGQLPPQPPGMQPFMTIASPSLPPPRLPDIRGYHEGKMKVLASADPYKDDFYYHTFLRKKEEKMRVGDGPLPPVIMPLSKEVKDSAAKNSKVKNYVMQKKTRAWEEDHKILGHFPRNDINRPRELLLLSQELDDNNAVEGEEEYKKGGAGFTSQLWKARVSIMKANNVLLNVQELMHLLASPDRPADRRENLLQSLRGLIDDLGRSLGLPSYQQVEGEDEASIDMRSRELESQLDICFLAKVLELPKGKKAVIRSIPLLHPDQRWALIPSIIAIMLARRPPTSADSMVVEEEMFTMMRSLVLGSTGKKPGLNRPAAPLSVVSRCVELILMSHRERKGSIKTALGNVVSRAQLLQDILDRGSEVCNTSDIRDSKVQMWNRMHAEIMELISSS